MKRFKWYTGILLLTQYCSLAVAQPLPAPKGWSETTINNTRILSKGTVQIEIEGWRSLEGLTIDAYLENRKTMVPAGAVFVSAENAAPEKIPGAFSLVRKVKWNDKRAVSVLSGCPGQPGHVRVMTLTGKATKFLALASGASFMEQVCLKEPKGGHENLALTSTSDQTNHVEAEAVPQYSGWSHNFDSDTGIHTYRRKTGPAHLIRIFPSESMDNRHIKGWFKKKVKGFRPPEGKWLSEKDKFKYPEDNSAVLSRVYNTANKGRKLMTLIALTLDMENVRLAVMQNFTVDDRDFKESVNILGDVTQKLEQQSLAAASHNNNTVSGDTVSGGGNTTDLSTTGRDLSAENAKIPKANRPKSAVSILKIELHGLPMVGVGVGHMMMTFPNGYSTYCSQWNLVSQSPTPESIGSNCELEVEPQNDTLLYPFEPGETIDAVYAGISGEDYGLITGGASPVFSADRAITLKKNGRITLGSRTLKDFGVSAPKQTIGGRYYLDGYTITIETDTGDLLHSFIGAEKKQGGKVKTLFFNDNYYSSELKQ